MALAPDHPSEAVLSLTVHCHLANFLGKETRAGKEMLFKKATALTADLDCQIRGAGGLEGEALTERATAV